MAYQFCRTRARGKTKGSATAKLKEAPGTTKNSISRLPKKIAALIAGNRQKIAHTQHGP